MDCCGNTATGVASHSIDTKKKELLVRIIAKVFKTGRKYADDFKKTMTIQFDHHLPNWNYPAIPDAT